MLVLVNLDLGKNQLLNAVVQVLASDPASPAAGQIYYNSTNNTLRYYNGAAWVQLTASGTATDSNQLNGQPGTYYLNRANHSGSQAAATISDFDTQVRTSRLDQFSVPTAAINLNGQRIVGQADPVNPQDSATKAYVDTAIAVGTNKGAARASVGTNVTLSAPGASLDGVALNTGDLVLLTGQTTAAQNGLYVWNGASVAMTRATNADTNAEVKPGMFVFVSEGTTRGNTQWQLITDDPITLGTTALAFTQIGAGTSYTAGTGIILSGNVIAQDTANGFGVRRFSAAVGDGTATNIVVTHNLGTRDVHVQVFRAASPFDMVIPDVTATTVNTITLSFTTAPAAGQYRCVVVA